LISIFLNRKASWTSNAKENQLAIVAVVLKFMFTISPLLNFSLGLCISLEVVNEIKFEELALTKGAFDSLRGGLSLGLGNGDWVMGM
jgi:hypothetical protein